ncbi:hypothetical protein ABK040_015953 [Willaertia magna]
MNDLEDEIIELRKVIVERDKKLSSVEKEIGRLTTMVVMLANLNRSRKVVCNEENVESVPKSDEDKESEWKKVEKVNKKVSIQSSNVKKQKTKRDGKIQESGKGSPNTKKSLTLQKPLNEKESVTVKKNKKFKV